MTNEPSWTASRAVTGWPVERVELHGLAIDVGVPLGWEPEERGTGAPAQIAVHRGPSRAEQLAVQLVEDADESRPLSAWLDAVVTVAGFPVPELLGDGDGRQPDLVEWRDVGAAPGYAERLGADDSHLYDGLAVLASRPPQLARLYVVLLRGRPAGMAALAVVRVGLPARLAVRARRGQRPRARRRDLRRSRAPLNTGRALDRLHCLRVSPRCGDAGAWNAVLRHRPAEPGPSNAAGRR